MSNKINPKNATKRQILELKKALLDYQFIMDNKYSKDKKSKEDFKDVYYKFYLSARWAVYANEDNRKKYFEVFDDQKDTTELIKIVQALHDKLNDDIDPQKTFGYDFSVATKILHTHHPENPIFDSKVKKYLDSLAKKNEEKFYWSKDLKISEDKQGQIEHDWKLLNDWYKNFQKSDEGKDWIDWFDNEFPDYKDISNVKKIDFIIFALSE